MSEVKDGGPAFPIRERTEHSDGEIICNEWPGLTKREWFAGMVLQGFLAGPKGRLKFADNSKPETEQDLARACFLQADAMIQESEGSGEKR